MNVTEREDNRRHFLSGASTCRKVSYSLALSLVFILSCVVLLHSLSFITEVGIINRICCYCQKVFSECVRILLSARETFILERFSIDDDLFAVQEDESHPSPFVGVVSPKMVGSPLDASVAGLHGSLFA